MKAQTILAIAATAIYLPSIALADKYKDLAAKGYRWVTTDGPFACASKDEVQRILKDQSDENKVRMVSEGGVYFLIRGVIVQVLQEDKASGLSQVRWDGITENLWTPSRFLSKQPITNILGTISVPGQPIGTNIPGTNSQLGTTPMPGATATPVPTVTPTHGEAAEPGASPTP
jgi:hypothetical protein